MHDGGITLTLCDCICGSRWQSNHVPRAGDFLDIGSSVMGVSWVVWTRLHYAGEVQWVKKQWTQRHPYWWGFIVRVQMAGGGGGGGTGR